MNNIHSTYYTLSFFLLFLLVGCNQKTNIRPNNDYEQLEKVRFYTVCFSLEGNWNTRFSKDSFDLGYGMKTSVTTPCSKYTGTRYNSALLYSSQNNECYRGALNKVRDLNDFHKTMFTDTLFVSKQPEGPNDANLVILFDYASRTDTFVYINDHFFWFEGNIYQSIEKNVAERINHFVENIAP